jgi:SPP1 gp7 family putative phage head morphogenesis protein
MSYSNEFKDSYWKVYALNAESYEKPLVSHLKSIFSAQQTEALANLRTNKLPLVSVDKFKADYSEKIYPTLRRLLVESVKNGVDLVAPKNPHKDIPSALSQAALIWLRTRIGWAADEIGEETERMLRQSLEDGYAAGESMDQIADRVQGAFDVDLVRAQRIARTETIGAANFGAKTGYREAGVSQLEWLSARDDRTCEICEPMDGEMFPINNAPDIPFSSHPNCRCTWLPVLE